MFGPGVKWSNRRLPPGHQPSATSPQAPGRLQNQERKGGKKGQQQLLAYQTPDNIPPPSLSSILLVGAHSLMAQSICPLIKCRYDNFIRQIVARDQRGPSVSSSLLVPMSCLVLLQPLSLLYPILTPHYHSWGSLICVLRMIVLSVCGGQSLNAAIAT